jgi:predicted DNA-binding protein (MmcQ/YjbR family)
VTPHELRSWCLGMPGSQETFPFAPETSVFKVAGKIFAIARLDGEPLRVSMKCEPALAEQLRLSHPSIVPGYHLDKRHWNTVTLDGSLDDGMVRDLVEDSYALVVDGLPRRAREALGAGGSSTEESG